MQMEFQPRLYRAHMNRDRFRFFAVSFRESDLLIGVAHRHYRPEMERVVLEELQRLRTLIQSHATRRKNFLSSHAPLDLPGRKPADPSSLPSTDPSFQPSLDLPGRLPPELQVMYACGKETSTGPMSSVAGLFAEQAGRRLEERFGLDEVIVENGGDLYIRNTGELVTAIHAGTSPLSDKVGFLVPPGIRGICTSSGTLGHSFSYGKADAVTVIAASTPLADAWATALGNQVTSAGDIDRVLERVAGIPSILGCAVIVGDRIGIRGEFEVKLLT